MFWTPVFSAAQDAGVLATAITALITALITGVVSVLIWVQRMRESGAKAQAEALARIKVPTIAAVSCNPATLARDLRILIDGGYRIERVTPIDQFVYSGHVETVAILRRSR